jgi:hypothetical protein
MNFGNVKVWLLGSETEYIRYIIDLSFYMLTFSCYDCGSN